MAARPSKSALIRFIRVIRVAIIPTKGGEADQIPKPQTKFPFKYLQTESALPYGRALLNMKTLFFSLQYIVFNSSPPQIPLNTTAESPAE
jgi:hypothetical protein